MIIQLTEDYEKSKFTHLPARDATFNGFKRSSIHANYSCGWLWSRLSFWNINSLSSG